MRFRAEPAVWRPLLAASLPLGLALAINELYFRADTLIISLYEPYEQVGLYTLAYRILEFTLVLGTIFLTTIFPLLSEAVARDEPRALRTIQTLHRPVRDRSARRWSPAAWCWRRQMIELAGGADFDDAATPLRILLRGRRARRGSTACSASR